jgi:hypothetical protein
MQRDRQALVSRRAEAPGYTLRRPRIGSGQSKILMSFPALRPVYEMRCYRNPSPRPPVRQVGDSDSATGSVPCEGCLLAGSGASACKPTAGDGRSDEHWRAAGRTGAGGSAQVPSAAPKLPEGGRRGRLR